ncbi:MAG: molybdopterin-dependent oxidoreductase [Myxococcales bacterium]|nr:molybdopterin-dependent oxidoreductase [Myxococcales bacterium]
MSERDPKQPGLVGRRGRRGDLVRKVRGEVRYTDDIKLPRMLHARLLRCPHPHARIVSIDASRALDEESVVAVITGRDMPRRYGIIPWTPDEYPLALDTARFIGDAVAAVAALDERTADLATRLIDVEYDVLPSVLGLDDAERRPEVGLGAKGTDNISKTVDLAFGDVEGALAGSDLVLEGDYYFEGTAHAPIEPHCAIGQYDGDGLLTVWSTTQVPHYLHRELSRVLAISPARIRVIQPPVGGAFGGKSEPFSLEFAAAKLAMVTGRPVKILYTREEEFYAHRGRHPMAMRYVVGAKSDGTLTAVDAKTRIDGGAYSSFGLVTTYYSGQLLTLPSFAPNYRFSSTRYFTNKPPCGPKRGHGSVQPRFAFESMLDRIAVRLGVDPIELRRKNAVVEGQTVNGFRVTSNGYLECLARVEEASGWKTRRGKLGFGRGLGIASSAYISGTNYPIYPNEMPQSAVQLKVDRSGVVTVFNGASEIGQGTDTLLATLVADELGLDLGAVRVVSADTDLCPVDLGAYSSRGTFMNGNAALAAARQIKEKLTAAVADKLGVHPKDVFVTRGALCAVGREADAIAVTEAIQLAEARFGTLGATGWYKSPPKLGGDYRGGTIGASPAYSFTAHVAEVEVDPRTGVVNVVKVWCAHDCGRALCPTLVDGQIEGSVYMGVAEALLEEHVIDERGLHRGPSLLDYRIPTSLDVPDIVSILVESHDPEGPLGAKEAGEGPLHSSIPAVANAICDAVGIRLHRLPFSPGRVLSALRRREAAHGGVAAEEE